MSLSRLKVWPRESWEKVSVSPVPPWQARAVFSESNIRSCEKSDPGTPLILFRQDTVPEDYQSYRHGDGADYFTGGTDLPASVGQYVWKRPVWRLQTSEVYETGQYCEIR